MREQELKALLPILGLDWQDFHNFIIGQTITSDKLGTIYYDHDVDEFIKSKFKVAKMAEKAENLQKVMKASIEIGEGLIAAYSLPKDQKKITLNVQTVYIKINSVNAIIGKHELDYDLFLMLFEAYLWHNRLGVWDGRETFLGKSKKEAKPVTLFLVNNEFISSIHEKAKMLSILTNSVIEIEIGDTVEKGTLKFSHNFSWGRN
jgi:hypothetical protein